MKKKEKLSERQLRARSRLCYRCQAAAVELCGAWVNREDRECLHPVCAECGRNRGGIWVCHDCCPIPELVGLSGVDSQYLREAVKRG